MGKTDKAPERVFVLVGSSGGSRSATSGAAIGPTPAQPLIVLGPARNGGFVPRVL